jgi:hypothetical protein
VPATVVIAVIPEVPPTFAADELGDRIFAHRPQFGHDALVAEQDLLDTVFVHVPTFGTDRLVESAFPDVNLLDTVFTHVPTFGGTDELAEAPPDEILRDTIFTHVPTFGTDELAEAPPDEILRDTIFTHVPTFGTDELEANSTGAGVSVGTSTAAALATGLFIGAGESVGTSTAAAVASSTVSDGSSAGTSTVAARAGPGTIWDSGNKHADIVLGRGDTVAGKTASNGTWRTVLANTSKSTGKWYLEYYVNIFNGSGWLAGFGNSSTSKTTFAGADTNSIGMQLRSSSTAILIYNGSTIATWWSITNPFGYVVSMAIDLDAKLIWVRTDRNTTWNNNGSADPATGVGGQAYSPTGALFPVFSALDASQANCATLNAGAYPFSMAAPSGFTAWDTGMPSPTGLVGTTPSTFNPSDKAATVTLSNGNLTATQNTTASTFEAGRSTTSRGSGLAYFELTITSRSSSSGHNQGTVFGFANSSATLTGGYPGANNNSVGAQTGDNPGGILYNTAAYGTYIGTQVSAGDVVGIAVDMNKGLFWIKNVTTASNWNNSASADPAAGVGGFGVPTVSDAFFMWAGANLGVVADVSTVNFGAAAFAGTLPSGYVAWG